MVYRLMNRPRRLTLFLIGVVIYLTLGLAIVDRHSTRVARDAANDAQKLQNYNANKAACGIRKLVDLPSQEKLLHTYMDAAKDPKLDKAAKARNRARITLVKKQIRNGKNVIELFGRIPPDYDCAKLPKNPPEV